MLGSLCLPAPVQKKGKKKGKRRPYLSALPFLVAVLCLISAAGCATSVPFQQGTVDAGALVGERTKAYALQKEDAQGAMDAGHLLDLCADADKLTLEAFETAWTPVRSKYLLYLEQDPRLTVVDRQIRRDTVSKVDGLIAKERARARNGLPLLQRP